MTAPVSIVIASRERPGLLMRCLTGVSQLDFPQFEVIVVACPEGVQAVSDWKLSSSVKVIPFDEPNISKARNLGIAAAGGEIIAFIDDDAVPEPQWLRHLIAPFEDPQIASSGGYVLGRNGISFQWRARAVDGYGVAWELENDSTDSFVPSLQPGEATKTEGTNMAVRRDALLAVGGFDTGFAFYLDETDLNLRLGQLGHKTAIVPLAQVHHGFAESRRRSASRVPRDLYQIGRSYQYFLTKHCPEPERAAALKAFLKQQKNRLLRWMQSGPLGADDVWRLARGLKKGAKAQVKESEFSEMPLADGSATFAPFPMQAGSGHVTIAGRSWQRKSKRAKAAELVAQGHVVSLFLFSPTALFHKIRYTEEGFWEQTGGLFGRSERTQPAFQLVSFRKRLARELDRIRYTRVEH